MNRRKSEWGVNFISANNRALLLRKTVCSSTEVCTTSSDDNDANSNQTRKRLGNPSVKSEGFDMKCTYAINLKVIAFDRNNVIAMLNLNYA